MRDATNAILCVFVMLTLWAGIPAPAQAEAPVEIINASTPTRCAEEDNVYIKLQGERVRRFRIEARHPSGGCLPVRTSSSDDLRYRGLATCRPHVSELLASEQRPGTGRHANRNRLPSPAALDPLPGARQGSPGALSHRRLLAGASFGASELARNGVRLFFSRRASGGTGAAPGRLERRRVRSCLAHLLAELRSRRQRDATA
jgi:hypothetical protein